MDGWQEYVKIHISLMASIMVMTMVVMFMYLSGGITQNMQRYINNASYMKEIREYRKFEDKVMTTYDIYGLLYECQKNKKYYRKIVVDHGASGGADWEWVYPIKDVSVEKFEDWFPQVAVCYRCEVVTDVNGQILELRFTEV